MSLTTTQIANLIAANGYADIAAMNADKRTYSPIPLKGLAAYLRKTKLMLVLQASTDPLAKVFLGQLEDTRQIVLDTTDNTIATDLQTMATSLVAAGQATADDISVILAMGGGLLVPNTVTQADFDAGVAINTLNAAKTQRQKDFQVWYNEQIGAIMRATDAASMPVVPEAGS